MEEAIPHSAKSSPLGWFHVTQTKVESLSRLPGKVFKQTLPLWQHPWRAPKGIPRRQVLNLSSENFFSTYSVKT